MGRLSGKTAVITGGASGIGAATVRLFEAEGATVFSLDTKPVEAGRSGAVCDVSDEDAVEAAFSRVASELGVVDVLFNCAGIAVRDPVWAAQEEAWNRCFAVNVNGTFLASKHALGLMPSGGSIIHTASVVGIFGVRDRAPYSASKGAVVALTRNMAMDLAPRGIRVNCVCPGFVRTQFIGGILADPGRTARLTAMHPLGRLGTPDDIAKAVLFLASDDASWITGQAIAVDGGFTSGQPSEI
ncbi:MAG: SDR family oxidoreductase [Bryobacteraceae bacterium]|nr:SDR family oxidoreductase [Bryobacteraceae bacterium]